MLEQGLIAMAMVLFKIRQVKFIVELVFAIHAARHENAIYLNETQLANLGCY
jgi:hypothetical protein